jgi:hypothetical protein
MGRPKNPDNVKDISVFPEGYEMNAWDNNDGREVDIASSRSRVEDKRPKSTNYKKHKGNLWFPIEEIPEGWQYAWFTERLLNEPQGDNLQEAFENGWDFVKQSDHPTYIIRELYGNSDNRVRRRNNILMKKPKAEYLADQLEHVEESARKQKEISYLTDYFGTGPNDPRFVVENSGSYTPSYTNKRG